MYSVLLPSILTPIPILMDWRLWSLDTFMCPRLVKEEEDDDTKIVKSRILAWTTEGAYEVFGNMYR